MSVVESLNKNGRYLGALSFLLKPGYRDSYSDLVKYSCLLVEATKANNSSSTLYRNTLMKKVEDSFKWIAKSLPEKDFAKLLKELDEKELLTLARPFLTKFSTELNFSEMAETYEYGLLSVIFNFSPNLEKLSSLKIDQVRKLAELAETYNFYEKSILFGKIVLDKAHHPFWDYHFIALQHSRLGDTETAINYYEKFLKEGIKKGNSNAIKTGFVRYLECCQQLIIDKDKILAVESEVPPEVLELQEVKNTKKELFDIIDFRTALANAQNKSSGRVGYKALSSVDCVNSEVARLKDEIKVKPNFGAFYELYKYYSVIGDVASATQYLRLAQDFNFFLFRNYESLV